MNDTTSRVRPAIYYPSLSAWPHGFGYKYMFPLPGQRNIPHHYNDDYPYTQLHSRTPDWVGMHIDNVLKAGVPAPYRVVGPRSFVPTSGYVSNRLNIFIDDKGIITSLAYH